MRLPFFPNKRDKLSTSAGLESFRSIFSKFRRIQKLNTMSLELMARMEEALGGAYIFDRAFLESSVRKLGSLAYEVVYSLNTMSENRYLGLFDRFQKIRSTLDDILEGGLGPHATCLALPYGDIGWEMEPLVGSLNVCLAKAGYDLDMPAPDGFAITVTGCRLFVEYNDFGNATQKLDKQAPDPSGSELPPELENAIKEQLKGLFVRCGGPTLLMVRSSLQQSFWDTPPAIEDLFDVRPENLLSACRQALCDYAKKAAGSNSGTNVFLALAVHEALPVYMAGSIGPAYSAELSNAFLRIAAAPGNAPEPAERYLIRRTYPYDLVRSEIVAKDYDQPLSPGVSPLMRTQSGLYRGSALLEPALMKTLAQYAATFERVLGCMVELHWIRTPGQQRPFIMNIKPAPETGGDMSDTCDLRELLDNAEVLLRGGETVQTGIACGKAVHVSDTTDLQAFPRGAIAVARSASPSLSPVLRKASAIITELGTSIGHLATIVRELRVPGIFGMAHALASIPAGAEVTVDAGTQTIYRGVVEPLLACREGGAELYPGDPEYAALRRLLRWILPLDLVDPESSEFSIQNCGTYHDIIHFAHERSVEELLRMQEHGRGLAALSARKMELEVPFDLFVVDIGGGISTSVGDTIALHEVLSEPFCAFLRGLNAEKRWKTGPSAITMKSIVSGLDRTFTAMTSVPDYAGRNHAIVAEGYMNVGLRLGYHFSVVDSYLGNSVNQNYIYFRFVGGFADEKRKRRRAELIGAILGDMRFKVVLRGDLVVGKLKMIEQDEMLATLTCLGKLTGFTRQLDMSMASETSVSDFRSLFRREVERDTSSAGFAGDCGNA